MKVQIQTSLMQKVNNTFGRYIQILQVQNQLRIENFGRTCTQTLCISLKNNTKLMQLSY